MARCRRRFLGCGWLRLRRLLPGGDRAVGWLVPGRLQRRRAGRIEGWDGRGRRGWVGGVRLRRLAAWVVFFCGWKVREMRYWLRLRRVRWAEWLEISGRWQLLLRWG